MFILFFLLLQEKDAVIITFSSTHQYLFSIHVIMNEQSPQQDRINELRSKIAYAETARDTYKETNLNLYETNSVYAETLRRELKDLEETFLGG
ncbi:MAG: hypothetical protein D3910_15785 [Candidatus Electrothrix sp. ATG2]|nr:hypothetical protein [Candidatus Electrothrix sp. ATG2]